MTKQKIPKPLLMLRVLTATLFAVVVMGVALFLPPQRTNAATASTINFQARLMTSAGAIVPDGDYNVEFKIYNALSSSGSSQGSCTGDSACLWTETRTSTNKVHVVNGYLTANLGSVTPFPAINWDQPMYLSMNIGGTGTPTWDGEMSPRLSLTAVPYAFRAGQLATNASGFTSTLGFTTPTANDSILLPDASGTVCLQSATACGFAPSSGSSSYIQLQGSSPGSAQTGNFNITGTGIAGTLQAGTFDTPSGTTTLAIGTTNATAGINLNQNTTVNNKTLTVNTTNASAFVVTNGTALFTADTSNSRVSVGGSAISGTKFSVQTSSTTVGFAVNQTGTGDLVDLQASSANVFTVSNTGAILSKPSSSSATAFQIQNTSGYNVLTVSTSAGTVTLGNITTTVGQGVAGQLILADGTADGFGMTLNTATLTASQTISLPNASGTICLQSATACGFAPSSGSTSYIQNTTSQQASSNFYISGTGNASTALQSPSFDAISGALSIGGGNASGITIGKTASNIQTTISGTTLIKTTSGFNSTAAFSVQDAVGTTYLNVSTSTSGTAVLLANPNAANSSTTDTIWLKTPKNTVTLFMGNNDSVTGYGVNDESTDIRFNGSGLAWGDFGYYPQGGGNGNYGQFRFTTTGSAINTTPNAKLGVGSLYAATSIGINNLSPSYPLDVTGDVNTSTAYRIGGTSVCDTVGSTGCTAKSGSGFYIHNQNTVQTSANFFIQGASSTVTGVLQANGADILDLKNSSGANVVTFSSTGATAIQTSTNTGAAAQVQNAAGESILSVGTTDANLISNPDIDINSTGWSAQGSGTSVALDSTYAYLGPSSLKVITGTAANSGAKFSLNPVVTSTSTTYTVSFFARLGTGDATTFTDIIARYSPDGSATVDCNIHAMNTTVVYNYGWRRFWCSFSSATTPTSSGYVLLKDTSSGTAHTFWVDSVQLEAATQPSTYGTGSVQLNATVTSPVTIQNTINSTVSFNVADSSNNNLLTVNSANDWVQIGNVPSGSGSAAKLTLGDTCDTTPANAPAPCIWIGEANGTDSDILQLHGAIGTIFSTGYAASPTQIVAINSSSQVGGSATTDSEITVTDNIQSPTTQARIRVNTNGGNFETAGNDLWMSGFANSDYTGTQKTFLRGVLTSGNLFIGNGTASSTPTLMVLATGNSTTEPTGSNGGMYYNSALGVFRCYNNATWHNCGSGVVFANTSIQTNDTRSNSAAQNNFASNYTIPANDCQTGRVYRVLAQGTYGSISTPTLTLNLKLDTTVIATSQAVGLPNGASNIAWRIDAQIICDSTTSLEVQGMLTYSTNNSGGNTTGNANNGISGMSNSATITSVNMTSSHTLQVSEQFSAASTSNTITMRQLLVEALN